MRAAANALPGRLDSPRGWPVSSLIRNPCCETLDGEVVVPPCRRRGCREGTGRAARIRPTSAAPFCCSGDKANGQSHTCDRRSRTWFRARRSPPLGPSAEPCHSSTVAGSRREPGGGGARRAAPCVFRRALQASLFGSDGVGQDIQEQAGFGADPADGRHGRHIGPVRHRRAWCRCLGRHRAG